MPSRISLICVLLVVSLAKGAVAGEWARGFSSIAGVDGWVTKVLVFDDGSGPALYVAGHFSVAGDVAAPDIARWDGDSWSGVGEQEICWSWRSGSAAFVTDLEIYDGGSGPDLYATCNPYSRYGIEEFLHRWDGNSWAVVGDRTFYGHATEMAVFDDGGGPAIFVGSYFGFSHPENPGPSPLLLRWDGRSLAPPTEQPSFPAIRLHVFEDGGEPSLHAVVNGFNEDLVERWDERGSWTRVTDGIEGLRSLARFDDGAGPAFYAWVDLYSDRPGSLMRWWDGSWSTLTTLAVDESVASTVVHEGSLWIAGRFSDIEGVAARNVIRWDGRSWHPVLRSDVETPAIHILGWPDLGEGPELFVGANRDERFVTRDGRLAAGIARWAGDGWAALGKTTPPGVGPVSALAAHDDGRGPAVYAAGSFNSEEGHAGNGIARWDGEGWEPLGSGIAAGERWEGVFALAVHDDGLGTALYAGGRFTEAGAAAAFNVARWDGVSWEAVGEGLGSFKRVDALAVYDDGGGPALYAGGDYPWSRGTTEIARWDGKEWARIEGEIAGRRHAPPHVRALAVHDDGRGPALYAAGRFFEAGATPVANIARWDGVRWEAVGEPSLEVSALAVYDDGSGPALYAAGKRSGDGGGVVRWDGSTWSTVGENAPNLVRALSVFDDGEGRGLFAAVGCGKGIRRWNGRSWARVGRGTNGNVNAFAVADVGQNLALYVGGDFTTAGPWHSANFARFDATVRPRFHRGDANESGALDASDGVFLLSFLFRGGPASRCREAGDCNNDGAIDLSDPITIFLHLFQGAASMPLPGPPGSPCGTDPDPPGSAGDLGCESYDPCG